MKLETTIHKLLTNKIVLYIVSVVSILNVLGYLFYGNMNAVLYFAILAGLVYYFSKNMIIVLLVPLILVNLWAGSQYQINKVEGMTTSIESEESSTSVDLPPTNTESTSTPTLSSSSSSTHPQSRGRARRGLEQEQPWMSLLVGVRCGEHHAFADAELHQLHRQQIRAVVADPAIGAGPGAAHPLRRVPGAPRLFQCSGPHSHSSSGDECR